MIQISPIYTGSLSDEADEAFRVRDCNALKQMIVDQSEALDTSSPTFHADAAKLMVTIALFDSLKGGSACAFVCDYVNF